MFPNEQNVYLWTDVEVGQYYSISGCWSSSKQILSHQYVLSVLPHFIAEEYPVMTGNRVYNKSNTTPCEAGTAFTPPPQRFQWDSYLSIFSFPCNVLQIIHCPFFLWSLYCLFLVYLFHYPFGVFKLFRPEENCITSDV